MQRRHVRMIATMAVVVVALTGARRSGGSDGDGGGCDNHGSSSSSSSGYTSSGTTGDSDSTGTATPSPTADIDAEQDVQGSGCSFDEATEKLSYTITIKNSSTQDYEYGYQVAWTDVSDDGVIGITDDKVVVPAGQTRTVTAKDRYVFMKDGLRYTCELEWAVKNPV